MSPPARVFRLPPKRTGTTSAPELQEAIDARVRRGDTLATIEDDVIEPSGLSDEGKAALWLYAWSFVDPRVQRGYAVRLSASM
jgi:hypothetical protein